MSASKSTLCDGCYQELSLSGFKAVAGNGTIVRYCEPCYQTYQEWKQTCTREEERMNRLLILFIEDSRQKVDLHLVPEDFPARVSPDSRAMLGMLRLG